MFANRFTAVLDACVLASALKRNLLLSLGKSEFFRVRWSARILDETEAAIAKILKNDTNSNDRAQKHRAAMERAFEDACILDYDSLIPAVTGLPDPGDAHVIAAAVKTRASVIVTDNLRHFPIDILFPLNLEARNADGFIADTIDLDQARAVAAVKAMRLRLKKPELTPDELLLRMEAASLTQSVDILRPHAESL